MVVNRTELLARQLGISRWLESHILGKPRSAGNQLFWRHWNVLLMQSHWLASLKIYAWRCLGVANEKDGKHLSGGVLHQPSVGQSIRRIGHKTKHIRQRVLGREAVSGLKYSVDTNVLTETNMYTFTNPDSLVESKQ